MKKLIFISAVLLSYLLPAETLKYDYIVMGTKSGKYIETYETLNENGKCLFRLTTHSSIRIGRGDKSLNLETETVSNSECDTFRPVDFYSKSMQGGSSTIQKGFIKNKEFIITVKNSNGAASKTIELPENIIFLGTLFYKYKFADTIPENLTVLSEESLSVSHLKVKSKTSENSKLVEMEYDYIPMSATLNSNGIPVITSVKGGLIISVLEGETVPGNIKNDNNEDIISKSSVTNDGLFVNYPRKQTKTRLYISVTDSSEIPDLPYQKVTGEGNIKKLETFSESQIKTNSSDTEKYLASNIFENSDYQPIKAQALKWKGLSDEKIVEKAVSFVYKHISNKNYANGQLTASEAYDRKEGDCTEHASLLAALLKASGIPVRMVYGLVLMPDNKFYYHNWNDVFINSKWQTVDSTFNMIKADSSRIALIIGENSSFNRERIGTYILRFVGSVKIAVKGSE